VPERQSHWSRPPIVSTQKILTAVVTDKITHTHTHKILKKKTDDDPLAMVSSVIFVLTYFLVLVFVAVFEIFFSFSLVLVFIIFSF